MEYTRLLISIIGFLLMATSIMSRNYILLLLGIIFIIMFNFEYIFKKFNFLSFKRYVKNQDTSKLVILKVKDLQYDYRDLSENELKSKIILFYKVLNNIKNIDIIIRKEYVDKQKYLNNLILKAQNLQIMLDADPSNEKARKELEFVRTVSKKIVEGEEPFKYSMYFVIKGENENEVRANVEIVKRGLSSLGIEIEEVKDSGPFFRGKLDDKKIILPTLIPYITPFAFTSKVRTEFISEGVYIGRDIETATPVFWNYKRIINPHILVIGPTGSGKTEFLLSVASKLSLIEDKLVIIYDTKGDIKKRLKQYKIPFNLINPFVYSLGLLNSDYPSIELKSLYIEKILSNSFLLDRLQSSIIYKFLVENPDITDWKEFAEKVSEMLEDTNLSVYFYRIFSILNSFDYHGRTIYENLNKGINVIDLTLISSDEIKRLIINTTLSQLYLNGKVMDDVIDKVVLVDEAWTILREERMPLVSDIVKRGRGYGISLLMATQNLSDLGENADIYLDNVGLLVFLNNGDMKFWEEVRRFAKLNSEDLEKLRYLGRGEALVRIINDPRPIQIKVDPLFGYSL